jgi:transcriptional regulator GlxA family with amidase domain
MSSMPMTLAAAEQALRRRVAVVAFEGISPFHLSVPCVVFGEGLAPGSPFDVVVCSVDPAPVRTSAGFALTALPSLRALLKADVVIVPSWRDVNERPPESLLRALRAAHARGALIVGLCLGSHVLAEAGLLAGGRATTHWEYATLFAQRFTDVRVEPDVLYVQEGRVLTSAGTAAGLDACLHLVRQQLGGERANQLARRLVIPPHREGGQSQYIQQPLPKARTGTRLGRLMDEVRVRLHEPHSLDSLALEAGLSRRTLTRQFKALTGNSVQAWLLAERVQLAQRLLERGQLSIERVAEQTGFGSAESFRLQFRQSVGMSPSQWRKTFASV